MSTIMQSTPSGIDHRGILNGDLGLKSRDFFSPRPRPEGRGNSVVAIQLANRRKIIFFGIQPFKIFPV